MKTSIEKAFFALPTGIVREIKSLSVTRRNGLLAFSELHLVCGTASALYASRERVRLFTFVSRADVSETVKRLCHGSLYAHRDTITEGFIALEDGIRVGICGQARYESGKLIGISDVRSLLFRFPIANSSLTEQLYSAWLESRAGLLIYSAPGGGKTTALRSLVRRIADFGKGMRTAVIDERCEFSVEECAEDGVDLYRGYKRAEGMMMAIRTMSAEVIVIDEIGAKSEAESISECARCGVKMLATVHARGYDELYGKINLKPLLSIGAFDVFARIFNTDTGYSLEIRRNDA